MATTTVTLTGNVSNLIGADYDPRQTKVWVTHNTDKVVTDTDIRLGAATQSVNSDGTFSFANVVASTTLVDNLQATVWVDWPNVEGPGRNARTGHQQASFGPYDLTGKTGTVDIRTLEAVQGLDASLASQYMAEIAEAKQYVVDVSNIDTPDALVKTLVANPASQTGIALAASTAATLDPVVTRLDSARYPALAAGQGDASDIGPALSTVIAASAPGTRLQFATPNGAYYIKTPVTTGTADVVIDLNGGTLYNDVPDAGSMLTFSSRYGSQQAVSGVALTTRTVDGVSIPVTELTLAGALSSDLVVGALVRFIGDDLTPDTRPNDGITESRVGQMFWVLDITGQVVTLMGRPTDTFSTNLRVAVLRRGPVGLRNGFVRASAAAIAAGRRQNGVRFTGRMFPFVENVIFDGSLGPAMTFGGCYGYAVLDNTSVINGRDAAGSGVFGYGILDNCSEHGYVDASYRAVRTRHAFTNDVGLVAVGSASTWQYGRPRNATISGTAIGTTSAAWDTHHGSELNRFESVKAIDCRGSALQLRGRNESAGRIDARRIDGAAVRFYTEDDGGRCYGNDIGQIVVDTALDVVYADIHPTGHPNAGQRENRGNRIGRVSARNISTAAYYLKNTSLRVEEESIHLAPVFADNRGVHELRNSRLEIGRSHIDGTDNTTGTSIYLWYLLNDSALTCKDWNVRFSTSDAAVRYVPIYEDSTQTAAYQLINGTYSGLPAVHRAGGGTPAAQSIYQWQRIQGGDHSSAYLGLTGSGVASTSTIASTIAGLFDEVAVLRCSALTANRTLGLLPNGTRRGQRIVVYNNDATYTVTIKNDDANNNTTSRTGADVVLAPGGAVDLVWALFGSAGSWLVMG